MKDDRTRKGRTIALSAVATLAGLLLLLVAISRVHAIVTTAGRAGFLGPAEPLLTVAGFALLALTAVSVPLLKPRPSETRSPE